VTGRGKHRFKIREFFADVRCSQTILDFLSATDVGKLAPVPVEEDAQSEASEWELRERREREEERRAGAEGPGTGGEEETLFSTHALFLGVRGRGVGHGGDFPL